MIQLFHAFIDEVAHRGVKGLAELIAPQLGKAVDFFQGVREKYAKRKALKDQQAEAEKIAKMSAEQVVADIRAEVARAFPDKPKLREEVELYLSLAPGAVQRTLRGKHDPKGFSAPPGFVLDSPEKVAAMFPAAVPTLRPNDPVPGREEKYRLIAPIGGGGFGEVWKAADLMRPNHFVAVKVFPDPNIKLDVIRHEYRQALRLNDPLNGWPAGVVPVIDAELKGEHPWIMYEFVSGGTLAELIVQWQILPAEQRVDRALAALKSLAGTCAHLHGLSPALVHRDLKPANVLGIADSLRITDLGLGGAAVEYELATESRSHHSMSGRLPSMLFGSYSQLYASPEQKLGGQPNPRDDVHALGVIGYQMLTGTLNAAPGPDAAEELADLKVPNSLARLVVACAAASPARRPENAASIVAEIARFDAPKAVPAAKLVAVREPGTLKPEPLHQPRVHGRRVPILAIGGVLLVGVILLLAYGLRERPRGSAFTNPPNNPIRYPERVNPTPGSDPITPPEPVNFKPGDEMTLPLGNGTSMTFCWCPPGRFERGSKDGGEDEKPAREITISKGFWMAKYETTQGQWEALGFSHEAGTKSFTLPVRVSHAQAVEYANKLKSLSGKSVRLPTEAEWEYACRAGTPADRLFWNGNTEADLEQVAWFRKFEDFRDLKPNDVGQKKPNPWGLHDMHGNVSEWCADWYDAGYYAKSPSEDPPGPDSGALRVQRGGTYDTNSGSCRSARRYWGASHERWTGVRLLIESSGR